jgi:hypothetical protein
MGGGAMVVRTLSSAAVSFFLASAALAQVGDPRVLRINEVLASNRVTPPADTDNEYEDLVEIYNPLADEFVLLKGLILANAVTRDESGFYHPVNGWEFQGGSIGPGGFLAVFCDGDLDAGSSHASFKLDQDGEVIGLFTEDGELIDMIVFPKIPEGNSYGRTPDGAGPCPALGPDPELCYFPAPTFKYGLNCNPTTGGCNTAGNGGCGNVAPVVDLKPLRSIGTVAGASPAPGAPVPIVAEAWDEKVVDGAALVAGVKVVYRVNGGDEAESSLALDAAATALLDRPDPLSPPPPPEGPPRPRIPDPNRSVWTGEIPGQAQGSIVTFHLSVRDTEGSSTTESKVLCEDLPEAPPPDCHMPFRYQVGFGSTRNVRLSEVCPLNVHVLRDDTDFKFEDYIELCATEDTDLSGMCLGTNPFRPWDWALPNSGTWTQHWKFSPGSTIAAGEHLLVWCDNDATWTNPAKKEFHTNFDLASQGDGIFLFDTEASGFGVVDGLIYGDTGEDVAWSRCPDCAPAASWKEIYFGSPKAANDCRPKFMRGDVAPDATVVDLADGIAVLEYLFLGGPEPGCLSAADANDTGDVDIADPIFILQSLFAGGPMPPAPFTDCGPDPTEDALTCLAPACD